MGRSSNGLSAGLARRMEYAGRDGVIGLWGAIGHASGFAVLNSEHRHEHTNAILHRVKLTRWVVCWGLSPSVRYEFAGRPAAARASQKNGEFITNELMGWMVKRVKQWWNRFRVLSPRYKPRHYWVFAVFGERVKEIFYKFIFDG